MQGKREDAEEGRGCKQKLRMQDRSPIASALGISRRKANEDSVTSMGP